MTKPISQRANQPLTHINRSCLSEIFIVLMIAFSCSSVSVAKEFTLSPTSPVVLTQRAQIVSVNKSRPIVDYTIWQNGSAYIGITGKDDVIGILPPGRYALKVEPKQSVRIKLSTKIKPKNVTLWARATKITKPRYTGNRIVITSPTKITGVTYDGTEGFNISVATVRGTPPVFLRFISPHNTVEKGPRVVGGTGGKTLIGQILPPGVYLVVPGQATRDGVVHANVTMKIQ